MKFEIVEDQNKEIELVNKSVEMETFAKTFIVSNTEQEKTAIEFKTATKALLKNIKDYWQESIDQAHKLHKGLTKKRKSMIDPCELADNIISKEIKTYRLEIMRIEAETSRKAEQERLRQEEIERQRLLDEAVKAEAENETDEAMEKLDEAQAVYIPPVIEESKIDAEVKTEHGSMGHAKDIQVILDDEMEILKAIISGAYPLTFIDFKSGTIKKWMKSNGIDNQNKNGIVVKPDINLRVTT